MNRMAYEFYLDKATFKKTKRGSWRPPRNHAQQGKQALGGEPAAYPKGVRGPAPEPEETLPPWLGPDRTWGRTCFTVA